MSDLVRLVYLGVLTVITSLSMEAMPSFVSIDCPGAEITVALGVSPVGEIVGTYLNSQNVRHGYQWNNGRFTPIDFPGALQSSANGINLAGNIVGGYLDPAGAVHGFLRRHGGGFVSIDYPGALHTLATAINMGGKIVGAYTGSAIPAHAFHGFLLDGGAIHADRFPRCESYHCHRDQFQRGYRGSISSTGG